MTLRVAAVAAGALAIAVTPAADAKRIRFGSSLKAPANKVETHGSDAVFWARKLPHHRRVRVPRKGRVATVRLKGSAIRHGSKPVTLFHFQVLHPTNHGRVRVTLTSGDFHVPVGGKRNRITTYHPVNLCARKGDYVSFSEVGGYKPGDYPHGTPFRVFSSTIGATTSFHGGSAGNGIVFKGKPHTREELLMQMVLVTGKSAGVCR